MFKIREAPSPAASAIPGFSYSKYSILSNFKCFYTIDQNNNFDHDGDIRHTFSESKWEKMKSCLGYLLAEQGKKQAVTIFSSSAFFTYRHSSHSVWPIGHKLNVYLQDHTEVPCTVKQIFPLIDLIWLKPLKPPTWPYLSVQNYHQGQAFYLLGYSPKPPFDPTVKSGVFGSSLGESPVKQGFAFGDAQATPGDSGGPCVDHYLGRLVGVSVGCYSFDMPAAAAESTASVNQTGQRATKYGIINLIVPAAVVIGLMVSSADIDQPIDEDPNFVDTS